MNRSAKERGRERVREGQKRGRENYDCLTIDEVIAVEEESVCMIDTHFNAHEMLLVAIIYSI